MRAVILILLTTSIAARESSQAPGPQQAGAITIFDVAAAGAASAGQPGRLVRPRLRDLSDAGRRGADIVMPLPGLDVVARLRHYEAQAGGFFAAGPIVRSTAAGAPLDGEVSFTVVGDVLVARVVVGERIFRATRQGTSEWYLVEEVDLSALPREAEPMAVAGDSTSSPASVSEAGDTNTFVDLLIVYTPAARVRLGGTAPMQAEAVAAVNNANLALANSGVVHRYRLVYLGEVGYTESGSSSTDLSRLRSVGDGFLDEVHGLRDAYKADVVSMLTEASDVCGVGYLMGPSSVNTGFRTSAFNVTIAYSCANANLSLAHEIGHNLGLHHDRANASSTPSFSYAYGYQVPGLARTVMAYACSAGGSCPRRAVFSTPNYPFPNSTTTAGTATEDNARAMGLTSVPAANFRDSTCAFAVSANTVAVGAAGGSGTIAVTTTSGCVWNAVSSDPAVATITAGSSSSGSGNASYTVGPSALGRVATLTIAGHPVTVTQQSPFVYLNDGTEGDAFIYDPAGGNWARLLSQAGGGFATTAGNWSPGWSVLPARFDADALTDFFLFNTSSGQWFKMVNDGGAGFTSQATGGWWPGWERYVLDLDGDGQSDFFLYDPATGTWFRCISTPTGFTYTQGGWNPGWEIYPMRLNADAFGDLFLINRTTGRWFWALSDGGTGFTYPVSETWFPGWVLYPGDFNGDGVTDFLLHDPPTGTYFVATTGGAGFTYAQGGWSLGWTPHVADLNADNKDDLLLHAPATGKWFQMLGNGLGGFSNVGGETWSLGWTLSATDFNGDGRADVLLYDPATGSWYQARNLSAGSFTYSGGTWIPGLQVVVRTPIR